MDNNNDRRRGNDGGWELCVREGVREYVVGLDAGGVISKAAWRRDQVEKEMRKPRRWIKGMRSSSEGYEVRYGRRQATEIGFEGCVGGRRRCGAGNKLTGSVRDFERMQRGGDCCLAWRRQLKLARRSSYDGYGCGVLWKLKQTAWLETLNLLRKFNLKISCLGLKTPRIFADLK